MMTDRARPNRERGSAVADPRCPPNKPLRHAEATVRSSLEALPLGGAGDRIEFFRYFVSNALAGNKASQLVIVSLL